MLFSIIKKEWLKIRVIIVTLFSISFILLAKFWYNLDFSFSTVEPESMMWYRFTNLEQKPYEYFSYLFYLIAFSMSSFQFIPERIKNRIRIMAHLPISLKKSLFLHLLIGSLYIFILAFFITLIMGLIISEYYPNEIILICIKDFFFYFCGSILVYLGVSSTIIEKKIVISILKFFTTILFIFVFHKTLFTSFDTVWILIIFVMIFIVLDSFYSVKEQRLESSVFKLSLLSSFLLVGFLSYNLYANRYKYEFNKYYIFFSPILEEFVYQKNFGEHQFEYGIKDKKRFSRVEYESYLPFVYWRNLDIQKKLPIKIGEVVYHKDIIKKSRLSFSYSPKLLKKQEVQMFPLINTNSKVGMIKFPEEMIALKSDGINIYNFDEGLDKKATKEINTLFASKKVSFPIKGIWGKATNMKPFDLGYLFLDSKKRLFRVNKADNKLYLEEVVYPKDKEIAFIKISENKEQKLAGYAISKDGSFFIIDYKTLAFREIELKDFDYKRMKLQLISNVKYYLFRYTDEKKYYAVVFDKNFKKLDEEIFE